jgi:hypothetical protein
MGNFFKPWRRKAGCVTLVIACGLIAAWFRSLFCIDVIGFGLFAVISESGRIAPLGFDRRFGWVTMPILPGSDMSTEPSIGYLTIAIPLTLLSVWLLLSKIRKSNLDLPRRLTFPESP